MITCSIEGDVLNMGYVIARESVSSSFKVKHAAGPSSLPGLLGRGSALGGVGEPSQELPPPLPSAGDGRLRRPVPSASGLPGPLVPLPQGLCMALPSGGEKLYTGAICGGRSSQEVTLPCGLTLPCRKAGLAPSAPLRLGGTGAWDPAFHRTPAA